MSFRELVESDNHEIFMNLDELAEERSIRYDGTLYESIPVVLTGAGVSTLSRALFRP